MKATSSTSPAIKTGKSLGYIGRSDETDRVISRGWRFHKGDLPGAADSKFDDARWQRVDLPHTFNAFDAQDGGDDYYRGPAWYRKTLAIKDTRKSYFLRFDGAGTVADVYVNGAHVGQHRGNFGAFCFEVSKHVRAGDNVVAVRVNNARVEDVPPLSGDFSIWGGLYRDVHLMTLDPVSIDPADDASPGVYLKQAEVNERSATLEVTTKLRNSTGRDAPAIVSVMIFDAAGRVAGNGSIRYTVPATGRGEIMLPVAVGRPRLWNGRHDPYLYTARVQISDAGGRVVDSIEQPLGLRYFRFDNNAGFFLNGKPYALHGVNRHQDRPDKGWAIDKKDHDEDMAIILEMGSTGIRLAHYQHADYFYQLCDANGLPAWAELPIVNETRATPQFEANCRQQLRELIKQNYNHPSIVTWSLFNEIGSKFDVPGSPLVKGLNQLAHELDPTRPTTGATHVQQIDHERHFVPDLLAFNRYPGWYGGKATDWPATLDKLHSTLPNRPLGISEYGAGGSIFMHERPVTMPASPRSWWRSEEYQAVYHEHAWDAMRQRPWLWGTFLWNQFDFAADQRKEGDHWGRNDKGLVTYDRKVKKDAFYFYKANWTDAPLVYVCDRRYAVRPSGEAEIKVYSNCERVELIVNGKSLGAKAPDAIKRCRWDVTLRDGENRVKAVAWQGGKRVEDEVRWTARAGAPVRYTVMDQIKTPPVEPPPSTRPATRPATTQTEG